MEKILINHARITIYVLFLSMAAWVLSAEGADVSKLTLLGLKLGMTMDEVKEKYPSMQTRFIKHWGTEEGLFYTATIPSEKINNWRVVRMLFSSFRQGRKLYDFKVEQFVGDNVFNALKKKVEDRFGPADCSIDHTEEKTFFWGGCPGNKRSGKYLTFIYKDAQMILLMEDRDAKAYIRNQVLKYDEETRLKEVLELDF